MNSLTAIAVEINKAHLACIESTRTTLTHAAQVGRLLQDAKAKVAARHWLEWVEANCDFSDRTARAYMRVSSRWSELENRQSSADLSIDAALKLLASPKRIALVASDPVADKLKFAAGLLSEVSAMGMATRTNPVDLVTIASLANECIEMATQLKLASADSVIARGLTGALPVARAFAEIRDSRLYRETATTFEEYCTTRWDLDPEMVNLMVTMVQDVDAA